MMLSRVRIKKGALPETPGVYLMKDHRGKIIYVGKAGNLRRRVTSYFSRPHDTRIERLVELINSIDYRETGTAIEALILEAELIKKYKPSFNIREKDDKSFLHVAITDDPYPRVILARGKERDSIEVGDWFGPFTSASSIREALKIIRRIFPWSNHAPETIGKYSRPCFDAQIGLCPGSCVTVIDRREYLKNISYVRRIFRGGMKMVLRSLDREMTSASRKLDFERADDIKRRIFALRHIQDVALIREERTVGDKDGSKPFRIEGYDVSNISGKNAVASLVVFLDGEPEKGDYRKFKIKTIDGPNDIGMLTEVLRRRFARGDWSEPDLVLVDGGQGQVRAAERVIRSLKKNIPVVGLAKGPERKRNDLFGSLPKAVSMDTLIRVRDEAHRFAISYHRQLHRRQFLSK